MHRYWVKYFFNCYVLIFFRFQVHALIEHGLRLRQHNIGYTADCFYGSDDPTNSVKALKEGG